MISVHGIKCEDKLFHNQLIPVYPRTIDFENISYWPQNLRTLLDFSILEKQSNTTIEKISLERITEFLLSRYELKIKDLSDSILNNGVRVPLIILQSGKLLDGNRRYFACANIYYTCKKHNDKIPDVLHNIPVYVIKDSDIDKIKEQKILAEANFVKDLKVEWTLDVKANVIYDFYHTCLKEGKSDEEAIEEIKEVYGLDRSDINSYLETIELTQEFINKFGDKTSKLARQEIVQKKFVYFWEFRNKAQRGRSILDENELSKVKPLFFKMILTEKFSNLKQVEPLVRSIRYEDIWEIISSSQGAKIAIAEALYLEHKIVKSSEDKLRNFYKWLSKLRLDDTLTKASISLLEQIEETIHQFLIKIKK